MRMFARSTNPTVMSTAHTEHRHHHHAPASISRIFILCIVLNLLFVAIETAVGFLSNSVGLLSDAGHNLSDVFSLLIALLAIVSDRFKEIDFRTLEGTILHSKEEIRSYFADWVADRPRKDEETFTPVARRMGVTLETTARDCLEKGIRSATVVMHSGIMRVGLITLFGMPREDFNRMSVANGRGVVITFDDDARPLQWKWL